MTEPVEPFTIGQKVSKIGGDYRFDGRVVAKFFKLSGALRYVVEDDRGVLHVYSHKNLAPAPAPDTCPRCGHPAQDQCDSPECNTEVVKAPAPAVCRWVQEGWEYRRNGCNGTSYHIYNPKYSPPGNRCPSCGLPISFKTEAQR